MHFSSSIAMGVTLGVSPTPLVTGAIAAVVALMFKYNMIAIQVAQLVMAPGANGLPPHTSHLVCSSFPCHATRDWVLVACTPVQLALIIPFMRVGEHIIGVATPTSLEDVTRLTHGDFRGSIGAQPFCVHAVKSFDLR